MSLLLSNQDIETINYIEDDEEIAAVKELIKALLKAAVKIKQGGSTPIWLKNGIIVNKYKLKGDFSTSNKIILDDKIAGESILRIMGLITLALRELNKNFHFRQLTVENWMVEWVQWVK